MGETGGRGCPLTAASTAPPGPGGQGAAPAPPVPRCHCPGAAARLSPTRPEHHKCPRSPNPPSWEPQGHDRAGASVQGPCPGLGAESWAGVRVTGPGRSGAAASPAPLPVPSWSDRLGADGRERPPAAQECAALISGSLRAWGGNSSPEFAFLSLLLTPALPWVEPRSPGSQVNQVAGTSK